MSASIASDIDTVPQFKSGAVTRTPECKSTPNKLEPVGGKACSDDDDVNSFPFDELHHNTDFELKNGSSKFIQRDDASSSSLDISLIESDEDESKIEVESNRQALAPKIATTSAVATANLSIVLTGNDIVVEYRDDNRDDKRCDLGERKESSPQQSKQLPQQQQQRRPMRSRPKGIMKRPRDSNITYHHPRRPLPPPLPPPGYKEISSPMSCTTATSTDSSSLSLLSAADRRALYYPRLKKRVSFNEKELVEQYKESKQRRKERYKRRRSFWGILSMAMPVIMPYLMAILILVASSMVPLPTDQKHQQQYSASSASVNQQQQQHSPLSLQEPTMGKTRASTPHPIFMDVGSRMWDDNDKRRLKKAQRRRAASSLEAAV